MSTNDLICIIEGYMARTRTNATQFGVGCLKDPNLLRDLKDRGRSPNLRTVEKILSFIDTNGKKKRASA